MWGMFDGRPARRGAGLNSVAVIAAALGLWAAGCNAPSGSSPASSVFIDLLLGADAAVKLPPSGRPDLFVVQDVVLADQPKRALIVPQPSRVTWKVNVPARAVLTGGAGILPSPSGGAAGATRLYIGISNGRFFSGLLDEHLPPASAVAGGAWLPIRIDLARYGGWQWSVFYRPWEITWDVIFNVNGPGPAAVALGNLAIEGRR